MEFIPNVYLYKYFIFPFIAAAIIFFPYLFAEDLIRNPTGLKETKYNFVLYGTRGQVLPIPNPQSGIFIVGEPGCGKTKFLIEPLLAQMIYKGYAGVLYDYDFSPVPSENYSLTHLSYRALQEFDQKANIKRRFISINFQDLTTSARFNPIHPSYIEDRKKLSHSINTFLLNLNPKLLAHDDFWNKNTYALLKSLIVMLSNKYPPYCTLPHAILLGLQPYKELMKTLESDEEAAMYASPILDAYKLAPEQFAGVMASFKITLERLLDKNLFWVLSGNDIPLIVNDPKNPLVVCLGNTPTEKSVISPVLSMCMAVLGTNMYAHDRVPSFNKADEIPTLVRPDLSEAPATGRKYGISTVIALQNMAQLEKAYTAIGAKELQDTFGNHFIGRGSLSSAQYISDLVGKQEEESISTTESDKNVSRTTHQKERVVITPQDTMTLKTGEFMGKIVYPKGGFFKMQLKPVVAYNKRLGYQYMKPLPTTYEKVDIEANFEAIKEDVKRIIS
ncbi:type IV secretory system conjugative DNA transfer family protein [Candidatus Amoebophilus asiaticus]|uniref:type IV secretory system conjugative DNA transfer family protein n=1 Tax=Candidatus Amoebophilus asiaticus TaxID=281120 RepID=UPI0016500C2F|nr:TraM recognition domain-containing protein [Candidatus Amoebophilus asiaticus]